MAETVAADLRAFNQDLPVEIRPAMRGLPAVTERAAAMVIGPADFQVGRFDEWDPNPPHAAGGLYIVYYYRGAKVVQSILDTYPLGFPAAAAQQQVDRVIDALLAMGPEAEALSDLLLPYPLVMSDLADRSPRRGGGSLRRVRVGAATAGPAPRRHAGGAGGGGGG